MSLRDSLEFDKELHSLYETKIPVSASKISSLTKLAVKHAKLYKNIVFSIEKFVQKCPPELKLAGLYVIDSIARAVAKHPEEGESYIARFEEKIESLIPHLLQAPAKDKERIKRTIGLWKKSSLFNVNLIMELEKKYFADGAEPTSGLPATLSDPRLATSTSSAPADPRLAAALGGATSLPTANLGLNASALTGLDPSLLGALGSLNQQQQQQQQSLAGLDLSQLLPLLQAQQNAMQNPLMNLSSLMGLANGGSSIPGLAGLANSLSAGTSSTTPDLSNLAAALQAGGAGSAVKSDTSGQSGQSTATPPAVSAAQMHRPTVMAGSLPSHWGQTPSSASGGASQSPKPSVTPSNQGTPQNNYPQQQQQRQQQAGFTQQQSQGINSQPQERSNSRWGSATTQDSTPIGRPIPVVGSDREGGTPSTPWQQAAAKGVGPAQAGDCMPGFIDPALPKDFMKILTRTVYVGGITPGITKEQVRDLFETIARVDTVTVNYPKFNAFVKLLTRAEADLIKERFHKYMFNGTMLKMGWGCGYGPKEFFDYASGETLFPMARMTDVERRTISQSPRGGGMIEGGMVVEEPDFGWPQKGEVCKGKYAAGTMPHAPGYLAAVQQRERGGFNNQAAAGAAPGGGGYNPRQNYMTPPGMPQIPRAAPSLQGRDSGMVGMPPGMPPQFQGMPRQPYRQSPHGAMHGSGGNGGIMVVTDRQYDEREERWRPKQQQQDRGEEHVVVLGGGTDSDEDTKGKDDSNNNDEHHNRGGGGDHDRDHRSNSSSSAGGYDAYHRMPPGMAPHFPYPPMMFGPGGYPMPPRPPPHWGRSPVPYPAAGGRPQWGPSSSSSSPSPAQDWNGTMPGGGMPPRKRQYSPDDNQQRDEDDKEKGEDRRDGDEEGRRQRTRWE